MMVLPGDKYMYYRPPESSVLMGPEYFKTNDGKPGLRAKYYKDAGRTILSKETIDQTLILFGTPAAGLCNRFNVCNPMDGKTCAKRNR